ncbi:MAG: alpha/beta hydrolase [Deinococcota bacterium]
MNEHRPNFVFVPGAWAGAWIWEATVQRLRAQGHQAQSLTLSGLEPHSTDTSHISLETHVQDVMDLITGQNLDDVILVGHSYSGVLAGLVTERLSEHIVHTAFVEAFIPQQGKSLLEVAGLDVDAEQAAIEQHGGRWPAPTQAELAHQRHLRPEQLDWLLANSLPHPGRTVCEPAQVEGTLVDKPVTYISNHTSVKDLPEHLAAFKQSPTWTFQSLQGGHWLMLSKPKELTQILADIAS